MLSVSLAAHVAVMLAAALGPILVASSPEAATVAAYRDACTLAPHDAPYMRYIWWDETWEKYELLTKVTQALLSLEREFPQPKKVCGRLMRIDLRESGHQYFLTVYENFAKINFVFYNKKKYFVDKKYTVYYPAGFYPIKGTNTSSVHPELKWYDATSEEILIKEGQINNEPAIWANPEVAVAGGKSVRAQDELRRMLNTEVPLIWGPFWMVRVQRQIDINNTENGVGYYEWFGVVDIKKNLVKLGIKNRDDYFRVLAVNEQEFVDRLRELRAYVKKSGVSQQERQIVVLDEKVWGTLDVFTQKDDLANKDVRGQPLANLRRGEFKHNAERWIGPKVDGLWFNGLFSSNGDLQNTAPDQVGPDTSTINLTLDKRIGPDNCIHCHGVLKRNYIIDFDDWLRKNVVRAKAVLRDPKKDVELELTAYLRSLRLVISQNRERYADAVARLTRDDSNPKDPGMTLDEFTRWYRGAYYQYVAPKEGVTVEMSAKYLGVKKEALLAGLRAINKDRGASDLISASYIFDPPEGINTLAFEDRYQYMMLAALGIRTPELFIRVKGFDSSVKKK